MKKDERDASLSPDPLLLASQQAKAVRLRSPPILTMRVMRMVMWISTGARTTTQVRPPQGRQHPFLIHRWPDIWESTFQPSRACRTRIRSCRTVLTIRPASLRPVQLTAMHPRSSQRLTYPLATLAILMTTFIAPIETSVSTANMKCGAIRATGLKSSNPSLNFQPTPRRSNSSAMSSYITLPRV